ncbi:MAG: M1 family metallopeptidase [Ferruginibacter sp.]
MFFILICFFSAVLSAQEKHMYNPAIDVQHYNFAIELNDSNDEINANAVISVLFLQDANIVTFDLTCKNDKGKGMSVFNTMENERSVAFEHFANLLKIQLKDPAKAGDTRTYKINYHGTPADGLVFSKNKFKQRTIFADNWPNRARNWLPCADHLSDKASVDFMVTAPDHYKVISNGMLVEESSIEAHKKFTHWKETVALPTKVMTIGLADFAVNYAGNVDCIPVSSWVFPEDKENGFYDYGQAMEILPFFIKEVGPYAYKKLANVEAITIFGGMENAGAIFYNEQSITGKRGYSEELIAHEIAHQWFGNSATESDWQHVWLSEGFATEMANLYLENKYGEDTLKARLKADREAVIKFSKARFTPVVDSSEKENYMALLNRNSYEKGGWVLHMLRRKMGDTLFWKGIRRYYADYAGKNASTDDLRKVLEEVSRINLKEFFQQWLYTPGHPELQVKWKYNEKNKAVILYILQEQKQLFSFPLEFAFIAGGPLKNDNQTFLIKEKITQLEIPVTIRPTQVIADPATNLLFKGSITEDKTLTP